MAFGLPHTAQQALLRHAATDYLHRVLRSKRPFALITASDADTACELARQALAGWPGPERAVPVVRLQPGANAPGFLRQLLAGFGLVCTETTTEALLYLVAVALKHEAACGRSTVIVLEHAERFGPPVLALLPRLAGVRSGPLPATTLVLVGGPALQTVLASPGLSATRALLHDRFDADLPGVRPATDLPEAPGVPGPRPSLSVVPGRAESPLGTLLLRADSGPATRFVISRRRYLIGRSPDSDLYLADRHVSRRHAMLLNDHGSPRIVDLGSRNGIRVNGQSVHEFPLQHGDLLMVGTCELHYENPPLQHRATRTLGTTTYS